VGGAAAPSLGKKNGANVAVRKVEGSDAKLDGGIAGSRRSCGGRSRADADGGCRRRAFEDAPSPPAPEAARKTRLDRPPRASAELAVVTGKRESSSERSRPSPRRDASTRATAAGRGDAAKKLTSDEDGFAIEILKTEDLLLARSLRPLRTARSRLAGRAAPPSRSRRARCRRPVGRRERRGFDASSPRARVSLTQA